MTNRLYYTNPYLAQFEATVQETLFYHNQPTVILDQSAFYPTGGGQPHDLGTLNACSVLDVINDNKTKQVLHVLDAPLQSIQVRGQIDWSRRFDLMQQHSGQHILSQALLRTSQAETIGFYLSQDYATIDLDVTTLNKADLAAAEDLANAIIFENRQISATFVSTQELATIPLRKPPSVEGPIRIVSIEDFDWSACGGTHVSQTGGVGLIKIIKTERRKRLLRLTFLCGQRTLHDYRRINADIRMIALTLSVSVANTPSALTNQTQALKQAEKANEQLTKQLLDYEVGSLSEAAQQHNGFSIISQIFENRELVDIQHLARHLIQLNKSIVLFGLKGTKGQLIFARSAEIDISMPDLLKIAGKVIGGGGGGSPDFAQGGGPKASQVPAALQAAEDWLKTQFAL